MTETKNNRKTRICMIVQQKDVKGGIASVTNGYYGSYLEEKYDIRYVESYCDGSAFKKLIKALKGYFRYKRILKYYKPDLVHMHTSFGPSFYRLQPFLYKAKKYGIPVINHCHGADFDNFFINASDWKKKRILEVYSMFDKVVVLSEEWRKRFLNIVPDEKIAVIHNYSKPKSWEEVYPWIDGRFKRKQVVFHGEIGERKGGFDLPEIIKNTVSQMPDTGFVICGDGDKDTVGKICSEIEMKCKGADVLFPGWVRGNKKDGILKESSVFLLPSYHEGQPMSILDAMSYGLPIVSIEVGGIPELVENGRNGYLAKPGDAGQMAEGIVKLLSDRSGYESATRESLDIAFSKYSFEAHAKKIEEIYDELVK